MENNSVNLYIENNDKKSFLKAYDEWLKSFGETNYMYPPQGPGKLVGNQVVGFTFVQVPKEFLKFLQTKKIKFEIII